METMNETCPVCQGSGMTRSGRLDCSYEGCTAAAERTAFNEKLGITGPWILLEMAWQGYRLGQQSMKEEGNAK